MEDAGMSDLYFKRFLKQLAGRLEDAKGARSEGAMRAKPKDILQGFKSDIEGQAGVRRYSLLPVLA